VCSTKKIRFSEQFWELEIYDLSGTVDFSETRNQVYKDVDIVMICYRTDELNSFQNIKTFWMDELRRNEVKCPIYLNEL
jgi:GTPase SAR1 family protein